MLSKMCLLQVFIQTTCCCCFCGFKAQQCLGQRYGDPFYNQKAPFPHEVWSPLQVQASGFELTTPILEAARSNHEAIHHPQLKRLKKDPKKFQDGRL